VEITVREERKALVVTVTGRMDGLTAPDFDRQAATWVKPGRLVVLDFAQLNYVSSAGLRSILMLSKQLKAVGGSLTLCSLAGFIQEVIELSGFNAFLPVYPDVASALKST
jgi:anti-anti-sigma factor